MEKTFNGLFLLKNRFPAHFALTNGKNSILVNLHSKNE